MQKNKENFRSPYFLVPKTGLTDEAELSFILSAPCFSSSRYRMKKGDNFRYLPYRCAQLSSKVEPK